MIQFLRKIFNHSIVPINRKLPLIFVHRFPNGESLYTYRPEDYTEIAYRHYEQITELQRYIQAFGLTPFEFNAGLEQLREQSKAALDGKDKTEAILQTIRFCDHFQKRAKELKTNLEALNEMTFCMFYVLEDEPPCTWSPVHNERKLQLLKENPDVRAFFFTILQSFSSSFSHMSAKDTAALLKELEQLKAVTERSMKSEPQATAKS